MIAPLRAEVVRHIFRLSAEGQGQKAMAKRLNADQAVPPIRSKSSEPTTIREILRMSKILVAAGYKLLLVIEDLDRNVVQDPAAATPPSSSVYLAVLSALCDRLRRAENVGLIVTVGEDHELDSSRLCDYVVTMPVMDGGRTWQLINRSLATMTEGADLDVSKEDKIE